MTHPQFSLGTTIEGFEVVAQDGRPVSPIFAMQSDATTLLDTLNSAAQRGRKALAVALGAIDDE